MSDTLPAELVEWMEHVARGTMLDARRQPGGARKEAWFVDFATDRGTRQELFLRYDRSGRDAASDPWTLHREAEVFRALQDTPVRVPPVLGVHPRHQAMLAARVAADVSWFSRIDDPDVALRTAQDFMKQLAALHQLDPRSLDLPELAGPASIPEAIHRELDEWERIIDARGGAPEPQLELAVRWLRTNVPDVDAPPVLVQGDTGPGNFMYADGRVVAVVDWELAHLGDPMDDIAWLTLRCTQDPFPDLPARLREYECHAGWEIDDRRVRYHQVAAETKLLVMRHSSDRSPRRDVGTERAGDIGNGLIYGILHRRLWFEAIGSFLHLELDPAPAPPPVDDDHQWLFEALLHQLRDVVPHVTDPLARQRAKGFARIVKHLRDVHLHAGFYEELELDELGGLLGERPGSARAARAALADAMRAGRISETAYVQALWRQTARDQELLRSASGALADRHWPELR